MSIMCFRDFTSILGRFLCLLTLSFIKPSKPRVKDGLIYKAELLRNSVHSKLGYERRGSN